MKTIDYKTTFHFLRDDQIRLDEPMKAHTTFRAGGPADCLVTPDTIEEISHIVSICKNEQIPYFIMGNGSNLLVSDKGYRGLVIQIFKNMSRIQVQGDQLYVQAGALLSKAAAEAKNASLAGMEFAAGIPGTIGGAVAMNAGAYGGEMKDIVESVVLLDEAGERYTVAGKDMQFGYRKSLVTTEKFIVAEAVLKLTHGDKEAIFATMEDLRVRRVTKQPLEYPSAGSTFKRPEGYFAGKLIMDAGLAGYSIGGAEVSAKHCGFIINKNHADASEIYQLICHVQKVVMEQTGVKLEPEVKLLGDFA